MRNNTMGIYFEKVSRFADVDLPLPTRSTADSAGYDFVVAEDIVLPPYEHVTTKIKDKLFENGRMKEDYFGFLKPLTLDEMAAATKELKVKIPLVSTGMKCHLERGQYLEISVRSSTPLKHWVILGNSVGIIDADYYNNPDNEGEIFFQLINLAPFAIQLKRGDRIGQGIIHSYGVVDGDDAAGARTGGFGSTG
jgi:dUTP pyrophosphatase